MPTAAPVNISKPAVERVVFQEGNSRRATVASTFNLCSYGVPHVPMHADLSTTCWHEALTCLRMASRGQSLCQSLPQQPDIGQPTCPAPPQARPG